MTFFIVSHKLKVQFSNIFLCEVLSSFPNVEYLHKKQLIGLNPFVTAVSFQHLPEPNSQLVQILVQLDWLRFDMLPQLCNGGQSLAWQSSLQVSEGKRNLWRRGKKPLKLRGVYLFQAAAQFPMV